MIVQIPSEILDRYDARLVEYPPRCEPDPGTSFNHIRWMIGQLRHGLEAGKARQWLGFIQGVMVTGGFINVPEEREFTRPFFRTDGVLPKRYR